MEDKDYLGRLVYLTAAKDSWVRRINTKFNVPMACRFAKVIKVFDWDTKEGKLLLKTRKESGKWEHQNPEDFKFILKIYYPDLSIKDRKGFTAEEVIPFFYPGTKKTMFEEVPDWMLCDFAREEKLNLEPTGMKMADEIEKEKPLEKPPEWLKNYLMKHTDKKSTENKCTLTTSPKKRARLFGSTKSPRNT